MSKFLRTSGISYNIEEIVLNARNKLVLVTPYIKFSQILYERLQERAIAGVEIIIVYGKSELTREQEKSIKSIRGISLYFLSNLHAKCYLNDNTAIITSMNLYEFSEKNNREMGILIDLVDDKHIYEEAVAEVESIIKASTLVYCAKSNIPQEIKPVEVFSGDIKKSSSTIECDGNSFFDNLINILRTKYSNCNFEYKYNKYAKEIWCNDFIENNLYLELIIYPSSVRINLQMNHKYPVKMHLYNHLESRRVLVDNLLKDYDVRWGNQMKRLKMEVRDINPLEVNNCKMDEVTKVIKAVELIGENIVPIIHSYLCGQSVCK